MFSNRSNRNNKNKNIPPPPKPTIKYNPPKNNGLISTLKDSFTWGVGMGAGSEIGHSVFRGIFGNKNQSTLNNTSEKSLSSNEKCDLLIKSLEKCYISSSSFEQEKCLDILDQMKKACGEN